MPPATKRLNNLHFKASNTRFSYHRDPLSITNVLNTVKGLLKPSVNLNIQEPHHLQNKADSGEQLNSEFQEHKEDVRFLLNQCHILGRIAHQSAILNFTMVCQSLFIVTFPQLCELFSKTIIILHHRLLLRRQQTFMNEHN